MAHRSRQETQLVSLTSKLWSSYRAKLSWTVWQTSRCTALMVIPANLFLLTRYSRVL